VRYSGIQLDTARYVRIQLDTVGYSGSAATWLDIDRYRDTRDTKDTMRYRRDAGEIQAGYPKIHSRAWHGRRRADVADEPTQRRSYAMTASKPRNTTHSEMALNRENSLKILTVDEYSDAYRLADP